ncbi:hypothetical protein [Orientia tsutsugamushi]|uniref:hypothetical protein n=1 Tax=Orientia tsutsugamushi TaxID=784 RepID=UPI0035278D1B
MQKQEEYLIQVGKVIIYDWKKIQKETGDIKAKSGYQKGNSHRITNLITFKKLLQNNIDKTSK